MKKPEILIFLLLKNLLMIEKFQIDIILVFHD
nr:MAG TPA: hypothetical protein [Inoviridae sp.]